MAAGTVIIGVGNRDRGDDGVGLLVALALREKIPEDVRIVEDVGDPAAIVDALAGCSRAILVDAASSNEPPGTIHRFDAAAGTIPAEILRISSHAFGAAAAIELARALGELPPRTTVYGIAGANFASGAEIHPAVRRAAAALVVQISAEVQNP